LDKYFLLYSHYIFWNVMVLLLEYVFSVLFPPLASPKSLHKNKKGKITNQRKALLIPTRGK